LPIRLSDNYNNYIKKNIAAMLLRNQKVRLRALEAEDLDMIYRWENDTTLWDTSSNHAPFSRKQIWEYINNYNADIFATQQLRFVVVEAATERAVGMIDLYDFDAMNRRAYVGLLIDNEFRNQGFGRLAIEVLEGYCYAKLGMHQLAAVVATDNAASIAMFKRVGYETAGCLRSWLRVGERYADVEMMQHLLKGND
jgi:diamine N-acetyltransferase